MCINFLLPFSQGIDIFCVNHHFHSFILFSMFLEISCLFVNIICLARANLKLWKPVTLDDLHFQDFLSFPDVTFANMLLSDPWGCGAWCNQNRNCTTWCHDGQVCNLTTIVVSPLHVATNVGPTVTCFTTLEEDYIVGSSVTFSEIDITVPTRTYSNLVKGIFDTVDRRTCGGSYPNATNPWVLFDLGEVKPIREVRVMTQNYEFDFDLASGAHVRIGISPPAIAGDFSSFKAFGALPDPAQHSTTYVLKRDRRIKGRYLVVHKPFGSFHTAFILCQVMAL